MVCLGIMAMALLALVSAEAYSARSDKGGAARHQATVIASSLLSDAEQELHRNFGTDVSAPRQAAPTPPDGYEYEVDVTSEVGGTVKDVRVTVFWTDQQGPQQYSMWTKVLEQ